MFTSQALATLTGPDRLPFQVTDFGQRFIHINTSHTLDRLNFLLGINSQTAFGFYDYDPSIDATSNNDSIVSGTFDVQLGLFDHYQMGLSIPSVISSPNQSDSTSVVNAREGPLVFQLQGKANIISPTHISDIFGLAFLHGLNAPIDNGGPRLGSFVPVFEIGTAMDWDLTPWVFALNLSYLIRKPISPTAPSQYVMHDSFVIGAGVHYYWQKLNLTLISEINTSSEILAPYKYEHNSPQELFFGVTKFLPQDFNLYGGFGFNFARSVGTSHVRFLVGISWSLAPHRLQPALEEDFRNQLHTQLTKAHQEKRSQSIFELPSTLIRFKWNQKDLRAEKQTLLDLVATTIKEHPEIKELTIKGHTDSLCSDSDCQERSLRRAESIRDYFIRKGINAQMIRVKGIGAAEPKVSSELFQGRLQNRRIELVFEE